MTPLDADTAKPAAVNRICQAKGWSYNPYAPASLKQFSDRLLAEDPASAALPRRLFGREETIAEGFTAPLRPPTVFNGFPKAFGSSPGPTTISAPPFTVLHVDNGTLGLVNDAPSVFDSDGYIHPTYSSYYYPILPHMSDGDRLKLDEAMTIDGCAIVIMDDVGDTNYCHWLCDWLPRLAALPAMTNDTYVVVLGCKTSWQLETLEACGFPPNRIVSLGRWQAVRARHLIVPSHMSDVAHPAYKGAPWAINFLGQKLDNLRGAPDGAAPRVYFSRSDARGRKIVNEEAFTAFLEARGYQTFVASDLNVAQQARLFRTANSIVSLHGAGLSNVVFCRPGCRVLEVLPDNYGTPAFWMLANGRGCDFATYLARSLTDGGISQTEDVQIDMGNFSSAASDWLST